MPADRVRSESPWHVIFLIDDSASMSGQPSQDVSQAMDAMIQEMRMVSQGTKPYFKISVIRFGSDSVVLTEAKKETDIDLSIISSFSGRSGTTNAAAALNDAYDVLSRNGGSASDFEPFVFFLSDGAPDNAQLALDAANRLKALSIPAGTPRIVSIGFGSPNDAFMAQLASNPELYKKLQSYAEITSMLPAIGTVVGTSTGANGVAQAIMNI